MSVNIQTGNVVKVQSGNRVLISAPGPQGPAGTGGTPGGTDTQVQFNDSSAFGGDAGLTYNKTTDTLSATNLTVSGLSTLDHIHGSLAGNLYVHVKNTSGGTLAKGTPVYATGSVDASGRIEVAAADYTNSAKMPAIGILDAALSVNAEGNAVVVGEVTALATNSYAINQELFVGTNGLLGALPSSGQSQSIAVVSRVHASTGIIVVNAQARLNAALTALANNNGASLTGITAAQVGAIANGDSPTFDEITLTDGILKSATGDIDANIFDVVDSSATPYIGTRLYDDQDPPVQIGFGLLGFRGDGAGSGTAFIQGSTADFRIEQNGGALANVYGLTFNGSGAPLTSLNAGNISTGTLPVANGGTGATTLTANAVLLGNGTSPLLEVAPSTSGNVLTSNGTTWTSTAPATTNPAGSGSELQFRSTGTAFGAVTNSSVSGGTLTLGNAEALATTPAAYLTLRNTTNAAAGAQQVSPSLVLEGRGWKTDATAASQTVRFRENILPVQGTANPSATWRLQSEINNSGTWTDRATMTTPGVFAVSGDSNTITLDAKDSNNTISATRHINITPGNGWTLFLNASVQVASSNTFGFSSDVVLGRDAANTLAQRNGTNAQTFRLYETDSGANDEYLEFSAASGTNLIRPQATGTGTASVVRYHTTTTVFWTSGSGSPESVVTAPVGSLYTRTDGGASTTLYVKETGTGSTGWVAK